MASSWSLVRSILTSGCHIRANLRSGRLFSLPMRRALLVKRLERVWRTFHTALGRERNRVVVSEVQTTTLTVSEPSIWVIDPLGNVVLKFEPGINPTLILQDLKKLLKVSKVG